jgi:hypothetical protein
VRLQVNNLGQRMPERTVGEEIESSNIQVDLFGGCPAPQGQPQCCSYRGNHTTNYCGCVKWKEAKTAIVKRVSFLAVRARHQQTYRPESQAGRAFCGPDGSRREVEPRRPRGVSC